MSGSFRFKQFEINQEMSAMKVGTDGVLIGAWCNTNGKYFLDIGTGSGLIALMVAQRSIEAHIDAIEIDENAVKQARGNVRACPWKDRINIIEGSLQDFSTNNRYDLIVSNPPFFIDSTKAPDSSRNKARHADSLSQDELLRHATRLLKKEGSLCLILPTNEANTFIEKALKYKLHLVKQCFVYPNPSKQPKRILMEFSFVNLPLVEEHLTIETQKRHEYTKEYITLTKDFYLNF